jgi:hypothetical protein
VPLMGICAGSHSDKHVLQILFRMMGHWFL